MLVSLSSVFLRDVREVGRVVASTSSLRPFFFFFFQLETVLQKSLREARRDVDATRVVVVVRGARARRDIATTQTPPRLGFGGVEYKNAGAKVSRGGAATVCCSHNRTGTVKTAERRHRNVEGR